MNYLISGSGNVTAMVGTKTYNVPANHPNYTQVIECLKKDDEAAFVKLVDVPKAVAQVAGLVVDEQREQILFNGTPVHNTVVDRILSFIKRGLPTEPLLNFLKNLLANPSNTSVEQLYPFLEHQGMPLTPDGCFLAYKRVTSAYRDVHTGQIDNSIGQTVSMERRLVSDDADVHCHHGLHVGSMDYVKTFGNPNDPIVVVKVNPADVVCVPKNHPNKVRVCKYTVVDEVAATGDTLLDDDYVDDESC